jgi:protein-S-isoprenylcysteine O-methyltransferase Ste14
MKYGVKEMQAVRNRTRQMSRWIMGSVLVTLAAFIMWRGYEYEPYATSAVVPIMCTLTGFVLAITGFGVMMTSSDADDDRHYQEYVPEQHYHGLRPQPVEQVVRPHPRRMRHRC